MRFTCEINLDNADFTDNPHALAGCLSMIARRVGVHRGEGGAVSGAVMDGNGNSVGTWRIGPDDDDESVDERTCPDCGDTWPPDDAYCPNEDCPSNDEHVQAHQTERNGGARVDRRICQGIGCPYGDH